MRFPARILCLLLSLGVLLMPLGSLHAHISGLGDQDVNVHGGHSHDAGHEHSHDAGADKGDAGTVVGLQPDLTQGSQQAWKAIQWIALASAFVIIVFELRPLQLTARPPRARTRPPSPYPHALPLLRGPPVSV